MSLGRPTGSGPEPESATAIVAAVREGRRRAVDVVEGVVCRHEATHAAINALVQPRFAAAAAEAAAVDLVKEGQGATVPRDASGPLAGVPVSIKECFGVRGLRTTLGIPTRAGLIDTADAEIVVRLRAAGAVVVGKANVPQAMYLHETDNPVWGRTNHPKNPSRGPGGSSGGDAAVVAAGVVPLAVGNDLAGSLRQPAHACGIATIMPRSAVLGDGGGFGTLPHLRVIRPRAGFLARSVSDLRLALGAVTSSAAADVRLPSRVGYWDTAGPIPASAAIRRGVAEAVNRLEAAGIEAVPLAGSLADEAAWLQLALLSADGGADIRRLLGTTRPMRSIRRLLGMASLPGGWRPLVAGAARLMGRRLEARGLIETGPRDEAGLADLLAARERLAERFAELTTGCDAVICPVSALPALRHGTAARLVLAAAPCLLANLLDLAAGGVPVTRVLPDEQAGRAWSPDPVLRAAAATDRGSAGLPIGIQIIAPPGGDEVTVLATMRLIEQAA